MSLREQFEQWITNSEAYKDGMRLTACEKQLMWEAYRDGHAANAVNADLLEALEDLVDKVCDAGWHKELLESANEAIKKARAE